MGQGNEVRLRLAPEEKDPESLVRKSKTLFLDEKFISIDLHMLDGGDVSQRRAVSFRRTDTGE